MTEDEALDIGADFQKYLDDPSNESLINKYSLIQLKQAKKLLHRKHIGKAWYDELLNRIEHLEKLQDEKRLNKLWNNPLFLCLLGALVCAVVAFSIPHMNEAKEKQIAIVSLVVELEQNKAWVNGFIQKCKEGAHLGKNGQYSWDLNLPELNAYEKYLTIACGGDKELSTKIINLYSRLESCGAIVNNILVLHNNISKVNYRETSAKIIKNNKDIENFCLEIQNSFDEPIKKLKSIVQQKKSNKTEIDDKLRLISAGSGVETGQLFTIK